MYREIYKDNIYQQRNINILLVTSHVDVRSNILFISQTFPLVYCLW